MSANELRAHEQSEPGEHGLERRGVRPPRHAIAILLANDAPLVWEPLLGRPLLAWSVAAFERVHDVAQVVVVVSPDRVQDAEVLARSEGWGKTRVATSEGEWRAALLAGLEALENLEGCEPIERAAGELVVVHEAARPLVTQELIVAGIAAARAHGAAMAGEPVKETIKRVRDRRISATVPRNRLVRAQTPLVFAPGVLRAALAAAPQSAVGPSPASLVSLVLAAGTPVSLVAGSSENLLVHAADDLAVAEALLQRRTHAP